MRATNLPARWSTSPSANTLRRPSEPRRARQISGTASATKRRRFMSTAFASPAHKILSRFPALMFLHSLIPVWLRHASAAATFTVTLGPTPGRPSEARQSAPRPRKGTSKRAGAQRRPSVLPSLRAVTAAPGSRLMRRSSNAIQSRKKAPDCKVRLSRSPDSRSRRSTTQRRNQRHLQCPRKPSPGGMPFG